MNLGEIDTSSASNGSVAGDITDDATLVFANPSGQTYNGEITGSGSLIKTGSGMLTLSGTNDYGGGTLVQGGVLEAATPDALPGYDTSGGLSVAAGATVAVSTAGWLSDDIDALLANPSFTTGNLGIDVPETDNFSYSSDIGGGIGLVKLGDGTLTLGGTNTYAGDTLIEAGTLLVGSADAIPSGAGKGNISIGPDGALDLNGRSITINGLSGSGTVTNSDTGRSDLTVGANGQSCTFDGVIENGSGTIGLTKTGNGTLKLTSANTYTGGTTLQAGEVDFGAIDSVFAESDDFTFNNKLSSALRLAEPPDSNGTFGLSAPQLEDGTLTMAADGSVAWSPDTGCAAGTYAVTATYSYSGGSQMKALTLTVESPDLPPVFPDWTNYGGFAETTIVPATITPTPTEFQQSFAAADLEGAVTYSVVNGSLPPGADLDPYTGLFSWTPTISYLDQVYTFDVGATDSDNQSDVLHVVMPVNAQYCADNLFADEDEWQNVDVGSSSNLIYVGPQSPLGAIWPTGSNPVLHYTTPAHGALAVGDYPFELLYTPAAGFHGVDTFSYWWTYTLLDYYWQPKAAASTNHAQVGVLVGSSVNLSPDQPYTTDMALVGVGSSTTVTLTLQNPRADGLPAVGYLQLSFPGTMRVYANGKEILPNTTYVDVVGGEDQITLTVVGVSPGTENLSASWHIWGCASTYSGLVPGWYFYQTDAVAVDVMGLEWVNNGGQAIPGDTAAHPIQIRDGERLVLQVVGVPTGTTVSYWWLVGDHAVKNYVYTNNDNDQVVQLQSADLSTDTVSYAYYTTGTRTVQVDVNGTYVEATFNVWLPSDPLPVTADANPWTGPYGYEEVNPVGNGGAIQFCWPGGSVTPGGPVVPFTPGMTFTANGGNGEVFIGCGFEGAFVQVIKHVDAGYYKPSGELDRDASMLSGIEIDNSLDAQFPYEDGFYTTDSPAGGGSLNSLIAGDTYERHDLYDMWFMARPTVGTGNIWVPLLKLEWCVNWVAKYNQDDGHVHVTWARHYPNWSADFESNAEFPTWDGKWPP